MSTVALREATTAFDSFNTEKEVAQYIRNQFVKEARASPRCTHFSVLSVRGAASQHLFFFGAPPLSARSRTPPAQYNGVWHCFVGRNFGAYMTHEANHHVYFYQGQMAVLLFKTG